MPLLPSRKALPAIAMMLLLASAGFRKPRRPGQEESRRRARRLLPAAPALQLEPKALEILKATERQTGGRAYDVVHCGGAV